MDEPSADEPLDWTVFDRVRRSREGKHIFDFDPDFPLALNCYRLDITQYLTPNYHDYYEIAYVVDGRGRSLIGDQQKEILPGDLIVVGSTEMHTFWSYHDTPIHFVALYFLPELIHRSRPDRFEMLYLAPFLADSEKLTKHRRQAPFEIRGLLFQLYRTLSTRAPHKELRGKTLLLQLLCEVYELFEPELQHIPQPETTESRLLRFEELFRYIDENYNRRITVEQAAAIACMSKFHFCRQFKRSTGQTFTEYVNRFRIDRAMDLLQVGALSVSTIATETGFENVPHFNRTFKKHLRLTPSEYVRRCRLT